MISEDVAKLILEIEDGSFAQKAGRDVELVGELTAAMGRGEIAGGTYDAMLKKVAASAGSVGDAMEGGGAAGGGGGGGGGGGSMAQRVQALTYAFQDFTSAGGDLGQKLNSITNNIPGIFAGLGSLTTGIGFLITAGVALYKNWDELTVGADEMKRRHDEMTKSIKEQTAALEALGKVQTEAETKAKAGRVAGVAEAIAPDKEVIRKALAADIQRDLEAETERLTAEIFGRLPPEQRDFAALMQDPRFARAWRRRGPGAVQREADLTIGRAVEGGAPELFRLQQLFGPETAIGARLAEAGPERQAQRAEEARDVAQQVRQAKLAETVRKQEEQRHAKDVQARQALSAAIDREDEQKKRQEEIAERHRQVEADKAERHRQVEAHKAQTKHNQEVKRQAAVAEQRFGGTAELMAERGLAGGMTEAQVQRELARRLGQSGVGREAAQEAATKATNVAMGKLTDLGGRGSELLRLNTEMTRHLAERLHQQERALAESARNLQAANQTNRKTGN